MLRSVLPPFLLPLLAAPFAGSVLGVWIRRLPAGRPIAWDRSRCETCGHVLRPAELIPVASYLWQRGRCRHCGARIAPVHLLVELAAVAVALSAACMGGGPAPLWLGCAFGWTLLALGWIDWTHLHLPDVLTLPLLLAGLAATAWLQPDMAFDHAAAAALAFVAMRLLAFGYRTWRKREGLGGGDAKLLAAIGAWVGIAGLGPVLLGAAVLGLLVAPLRGGLRAATVIPFGTCLAGAAWVVWLVAPA